MWGSEFEGNKGYTVKASFLLPTSPCRQPPRQAVMLVNAAFCVEGPDLTYQNQMSFRFAAFGSPQVQLGASL